jgi:hypothetical protein
MRYWLKRSIHDGSWDYVVEFCGRTHAFTNLNYLRQYRDRFENSRTKMISSWVSRYWRKPSVIRLTHYHFRSRWSIVPGVFSLIHYRFRESYMAIRYHSEIYVLLDRACHEFEKASTSTIADRNGHRHNYNKHWWD